jgi:hypothetical protein
MAGQFHPVLVVHAPHQTGPRVRDGQAPLRPPHPDQGGRTPAQLDAARTDLAALWRGFGPQPPAQGYGPAKGAAP